jgi:TonB family protein
MKIKLHIFAAIVVVTGAFAATRSTPGLPFGDVRVVAPLHLDEMPAPAFMPSPFALKDECEKRGLSGEVLIGFTISAKGKPEKIKVLKSTNQEMAQMILAYVSKLVFRPARIGGKAAVCEAEMPFFIGPAA